VCRVVIRKFVCLDSYNDSTSLVVKLRSILEEEKQKHKVLQEQYIKLSSRHKPTEDSFR